MMALKDSTGSIFKAKKVLLIPHFPILLPYLNILSQVRLTDLELERIMCMDGARLSPQ
jgi:hypothetical protein